MQPLETPVSEEFAEILSKKEERKKEDEYDLSKPAAPISATFCVW